MNEIVKKLLKLGLYAIIAILFLYLLFDLVIMPIYTRHGQAIAVPDLTGMFYEDAKDSLKSLSLRIVEEGKRFDPTNTFPIGVIMSQNPIPGSTVKEGRRIYVIVSKGEPTIEMPNLVHTSERNAILLLKRLGLKVKNINYEHSDIFHAGEISYQNIPPGSEVRPGTEVEITVSLGLFPDRFIVPDLIGRSLKDARMIIIKSGLTLGEVSFQVAEDLLPETVISQSLPPQTEVSQGDTINLLVSKLPSPMNEDNNQ